MRRLLLLSLLTAILVAAPCHTDARRTSKTVRKEQREAARKIERTKGQIKTNLADTRRQLAQLQSLDAGIESSNAVIASLTRSADSLSARVRVIADSVELTTRRVESLKASYSTSLRAMRRQRQIASSTAFVFSAKSFSEARKRVRYLRELGQWQAEKAGELKDAAAVLQQKKAELDSARAVLADNIRRQRVSRDALARQRTEAEALAGRLKKQGRQLEKALNEQQRLAKELDRELNRIIEEEARKAAEEERRRKAEEERRRKEELERKKNEQKTTPDSAAEKQKPSKEKPSKDKPVKPSKPATQPKQKPLPAQPKGSFADAKGKLPMPVDASAVIVSDFGRQNYRDMSKVEVMNNGVDIETVPGASAVAVFPGTVSMVISMDGYHNVVLVRHGEYLTVYAGISTLAVRKGQQVAAGQVLGSVYSDRTDDMRTRLHFEVRHEKEKLNPADWLR